MKWSRDKIIREILRRESAGLPLTAGGGSGVENKMYQAATRIFGSWRHAVATAGVSAGLVTPQERWHPTRILKSIQSLSRRRKPSHFAELEKRHAGLVRAARRIFGTWHKAVIAAGIDPAVFHLVRPWSRERVIEGVLKRALNNESLDLARVPRSLIQAAVRVFGDWRAAVDAAGLDPDQYTGVVSANRTAAIETGMDPSQMRSASLESGFKAPTTDQWAFDAVGRRCREPGEF